MAKALTVHQHPTVEIHWVGNVKNLHHKFFVRGCNFLYPGSKPHDFDDRAWTHEEIFDSFTEAYDYMKAFRGYAQLKEMCEDSNQLLVYRVFGYGCN